MGRRKKAETMLAVPLNLEQANLLLGEIVGLDRRLDAVNSELTAKVKEATEKAAEEAARIEAEILTKVNGLFLFAEHNRSDLTKDGKVKTVELPLGFLRWRQGKPSVRVTNKQALLKELHELGLERFIRTVEEIKKQEMLGSTDEVARLKNASIKEGVEEFIVKPKETVAEYAKKGDRLKRTVSKK